VESRLIRQKFIDFFLANAHAHLPSSSLVPANDPTVLFTTAGMQQLVPYLLGKEHPLGSRLFSVQKCVRTGDIDDVGDERHLTFFEMMGNWSLGDYFKEESIALSYRFLTEELGIDPKKLSATVFEGYDQVALDTESMDIWKKVGLDASAIVPLPKENNWWPVYGAKGPCGPDTEIHYDTGIPYEGPENYPGGENPRYLEIWNNVFMEFACDGEGNFTKLSKQNVDTGMGLERMAMILQGAPTVFETDIFRPLIEAVEKATGVAYPGFVKSGHEMNEHETLTTKAFRIVVDHIRSSSFIIADGVSPSNEGRGYVLRRLLRRAVYNLRALKEDAPTILPDLVAIIRDQMGDFYPEIVERFDIVVQVITLEMEKFLQTLARGEKILEKAIADAKISGGIISGEAAFQLHDTFGFPISLTTEIAKKHAIEVDMEAYTSAYEEQQQRSREGSKDMFARGREAVQTALEGLPKTDFRGYELTATGAPLLFMRGAKILKVIPSGEREFALVLDATVFYAESGGQVGDTGTIGDDSFQFHVVDTQKYDDVWVHFGEIDGHSTVSSFELEGREVFCHVAEDRRRRIMASHTGAHLLHKALKKYLGDSIEQAGSYVDAERTRFDFSCARALTTEELTLIEQEVNDAINSWHPVKKEEMPLAKAREIGAIGLFTDKYGETVRVVSIGDSYSVEFCGGTHVSNTSEIGIARILKESSVASGVRRIEMLTGVNVYEQLVRHEGILSTLAEETKSTSFADVVDKVEQMKAQLKSLESQQKDMEMQRAKTVAEELSTRIEGGVILAKVDLDSMDALKQVAHILKSRGESKAGLIANATGSYVLYSTDAALSARAVFDRIKDVVGGKGGGNDGMVQGVGMNMNAFGEITSAHFAG